MLKCLCLAQADAHVTNDLISMQGVQVEPLVEMLSSDDYQRKLARDTVLKSFDSLLRQSYSDARANSFEIKLDAFDGYGLYYAGENVILPKNSHPVKVLPSIVGYIEKIPDDTLSSFKEISIFKKTDSCSFDRVMLGATRFANHCCRPNCRYLLRNLNSRRCIQLEVLKPINKKDEITVFYGDNFFGKGNQDCLCGNVDLHEQKATPFQSVSISRQRLVLRPVFIRPRRTAYQAEEDVSTVQIRDEALSF